MQTEEGKLVQWVQSSGAINMIGPYLTDEVKCPICSCPNGFEFLESYSSPVKVIYGCTHIYLR